MRYDPLFFKNFVEPMSMDATIFAGSALAALPSRWLGRSSFTLLDLDFDGVRLLLTAAALLRDPAAPERLHYVAVIEGLPDAGVLEHAVSQMRSAGLGDSDAFIEQLRGCWPPAVPGFHRMSLAGGRLVLTLATGAPPAASLPQLSLAFDDAYCRAADVTPTMMRWLPRLAAADAHLTLAMPLSAPGVADAVSADFGRAGFIECARAPDALSMRFAPRRTQTGLAPERRPVPEKHAIVIGAGLAGASACHRLGARGWRCTLIEQYDGPARQASGNAAGIFMPVLSQDDNPLSRLTRAAYLFALHVWDGLGGVGRGLPGQACGVLQLARSDAAQGAAAMRLPWSYPPDFARRMESSEAKAALRQPVAGGWWFPAAGWLQPAAVCRAMLDACGDRLQAIYLRQAATLIYDAAHACWDALDADGAPIARAPVVILANGVQAKQLAQAAHLPLSAIRGQVTHLPARSADPPVVVCGDAYLTPAAGGIASLGATYDTDPDPALRLDSHRENLRHLQRMLPGRLAQENVEKLDGRVGFRCVSADRLPLVGALPDPQRLAGSGDTRLRDMPRLPGLYGLLGYGSRGLIWSPLAAELLAAQLDGEPLPLPRDLVAMLDPARFALTQRRQSQPPTRPRVE
jgi:tRNA 5-methylaminomethyl-2-thiouridine biosynthesis bifunctional protein